eukprot:2238658-Rhodomonas_salina.1
MRTAIRMRYAVSGTDIGHAATRQFKQVIVKVWSYTPAMRCPVLRQAMLLPGHASRHVARDVGTLSAYTFAMPCPVLTQHKVLQIPGIFLRALDVRSIPLRTCYTMSGTDLAYGASCQRARYAMPGTGLAHSAGCFHYAMSGTGLANGAICPCACYAMSSTDAAYGATGKADAVVLCTGQRTERQVCYAISGIDIAYARCLRMRSTACLRPVPVLSVYARAMRYLVLTLFLSLWPYAHAKYQYPPSRSLCGVLSCPAMLLPVRTKAKMLRGFGTDIRYAATRLQKGMFDPPFMTMVNGYGPTRVLCNVRGYRPTRALRDARYLFSYAATRRCVLITYMVASYLEGRQTGQLLSPYAMPSTDLTYRIPSSYAMSSNVLDRPMPCLVLTSISLRHVWY